MIELRIGDAIEVPVYKNVYELWTQGMSGDADDYNETSTFSDNDWYQKKGITFTQLVQMALAAEIIFDGSGRDFGNYKVEKLQEFANKIGFSEDAGDFCSDKFGTDIFTDGDSLASPYDVKVFYYDSQGIKHKVDIIVNGKTKVYDLEDLI